MNGPHTIRTQAHENGHPMMGGQIPKNHAVSGFLTGVSGGIRTPDPQLRRLLLYPAELLRRMERVRGIEPPLPAWKAGVLPLNYTRIDLSVVDTRWRIKMYIR
jgi:hypothetical protein